MVDAGGRIAGEDLEFAVAKRAHQRVEPFEPDDIFRGKPLLEETFDEISRDNPDLVSGQSLDSIDGRKVPVGKEVGVGLDQRRAVFEEFGSFLVEKESGVGVGPAVPHHAKGFVPGSGPEIDFDPRLLGPQVPKVDDQAGRFAVVVLEVKRDAVNAIGDGNSVSLGRGRGKRRAHYQDDG